MLEVSKWVMRALKELFNSMGFDPNDRSLKIQKFIRTPTPKVGVHLEM
jgi:hypothetical protein